MPLTCVGLLDVSGGTISSSRITYPIPSKVTLRLGCTLTGTPRTFAPVNPEPAVERVRTLPLNVSSVAAVMEPALIMPLSSRTLLTVAVVLASALVAVGFPNAVVVPAPVVITGLTAIPSVLSVFVLPLVPLQPIFTTAALPISFCNKLPMLEFAAAAQALPLIDAGCVAVREKALAA